MQIIHARCCGLDIHKKSVVACVLVSEADGQVQRQVRTFGTMTADLLALSDWLHDLDVTEIAMESTGVYWHPVFNLLEGEGRALTLVNPQHIKAVPGRKTDVKDAEWLAGGPLGSMLRHGLVKPSFIPPSPIRALREMTRYRKTLVQQRTEEANRLQKVLEGTNIKLAAVASNVLGKSGRDMLAALLGGETDPVALAELARGRLRTKLPALRQALEGRLQRQHVVVMGQILAHIDFLDEAIATLHDAIEQALTPDREAVDLLLTLPGVREVGAATLIAEIGVDMTRFPSAKHLASWAGVCPGNRQSGGKRLGGKTTKGNPWLRAVLIEIAWANVRRTDGYLAAQFRRLVRRRGVYKAIIAVAHSLLVIIYHILRDKRPFTDLGADYFERLDAKRLEQHHVRRLNALGYSVTLTPLAVTEPIPA